MFINTLKNNVHTLKQSEEKNRYTTKKLQENMWNPYFGYKVAWARLGDKTNIKAEMNSFCFVASKCSLTRLLFAARYSYTTRDSDLSTRILGKESLV